MWFLVSHPLDYRVNDLLFWCSQVVHLINHQNPSNKQNRILSDTLRYFNGLLGDSFFKVVVQYIASLRWIDFDRHVGQLGQNRAKHVMRLLDFHRVHVYKLDFLWIELWWFLYFTDGVFHAKCFTWNREFIYLCLEHRLCTRVMGSMSC